MRSNIPRPRRRVSILSLIVVLLVIAALLAALTAPESGDLLGGIKEKGEQAVENYRDYWPELSGEWEQKLRESKEEAAAQQPTAVPTETSE